MTKWINFKELRQRLDFEQVLRHYGVEVTRKGDQHQGGCPLPGHKGDRKSASFSANLTRGVFHCFSCGAKGNVLEFAALMESVNPEDGKGLRTIAGKLDQQFGSTKTVPKVQSPPPVENKQSELPLTVQNMVNAPLDFELKGLNSKHPCFQSRGLTQETVDRFGLGVASRGTLKGRIGIPLHDHAGKLVGYAGRVVNDKDISNDNPKYWFPEKREREGSVYDFRKSLFLYNGFRIVAPVADCIVVKGFTAVWWLWQCGLPPAVSTMGTDCSDRQAELIASLVKPTGNVWILAGDDKTGEQYATCVMLKVATRRPVRWVQLHNVVSATALSAEQLKTCFTV
jgi:DNA primase